MKVPAKTDLTVPQGELMCIQGHEYLHIYDRKNDEWLYSLTKEDKVVELDSESYIRDC